MQLSRVGIKTAPPVYNSIPVAPVGSGDALPAIPVKPGSVIEQFPPAGARVDQSTTVKLTAAK